MNSVVVEKQPIGEQDQSQELQCLLDQAASFSADDERLREVARQAKTLAERLDEPAAIVQACLLLSDYHLAKANYNKVVETLEPLLQEPLSIGQQNWARLLFTLVKANSNLAEIAEVLSYGAEALKLYQVEGDTHKQAQLHYYLGDAYIRISAFHEALEHYLAQLELLKSCGANLAEPYAGIGWVHCQLGDFKNALKFLAEGLTRAREENNVVTAGRCLGNMANVYDRMEDSAKALHYHQQATQLFEAHDNLRRAMVGYGNIGKVYLNRGDTALALAYFDKTLAQLKLTPNQAFEGWIYIQMATALLETDALRAERYLLDALAQMSEAGVNEGAERAHQLLSKLYELQGSPVKALEHYKIYAGMEIEELKSIGEKRTQALSIQFEVEHLQQEQEIYQLKNVELAQAVEKLEELSVRDALTGLYNRRYLDTYLSQTFLTAQAHQAPLTVLMSDIDNFKAINDSFSHATGDAVLKRVARILNDHTWGADVVARYGGEEFVIVFKETPLNEALGVAEKLRRRVESHPWHELHPELSITLSTGLCDDVSLGDHERMLSVADNNLYEAKRTGKNKVVS